MLQVVPSAPTAAAAFEAEYDRINRAVYANALPPFPGVEVVDRSDIFSMTRTRGTGAGRQLRPFLLSKHVKGALLLEAIRHEVAHAAAIILDQDVGHGAAWRRHAQLAGASSEATLDPGHPLRSEWPSP